MKEKAELAVALLLLGLGLVSFVIPVHYIWILFDACGAVCILSSVVLLVQALTSRRTLTFAAFVLMLALGIMLCFHRIEGRRFVIGVLMFYITFNCIISFVEFTFDVREQSPQSWAIGLQGLIYLLVFILSLLFRHFGKIGVQYIFGSYLVAMALQILLEMFYFQQPRATRAWVLRRWSLLPVTALVAFPGYAKQRAIRKRLHPGCWHEAHCPAGREEKLQILFEINSVQRQIVQMDFCYQGIVYAYGPYAQSDSFLKHSASPGIMMSVPERPYLEYLEKEAGRDIAVFGIALRPEQERRLQKMLKNLFVQSWRWYCPMEKDLPARLASTQTVMKEESSRLSWWCGAKFRRFYHGKWKTFWMSGSSGALFASSMLYAADPNLIPVRGLSTPLEFFDLFLSATESPLSPVVSSRFFEAGKQKDSSTLVPSCPH